MSVFKIRRTPPDETRLKKQRKDEDDKRMAETEYSLDLVPFGSVAHIPFENIKYGDSAIRTVVIRNPTTKNVHASIFVFFKNILTLMIMFSFTLAASSAFSNTI